MRRGLFPKARVAQSGKDLVAQSDKALVAQSDEALVPRSDVLGSAARIMLTWMWLLGCGCAAHAGSAMGPGGRSLPGASTGPVMRVTQTDWTAGPTGAQLVGQVPVSPTGAASGSATSLTQADPAAGQSRVASSAGQPHADLTAGQSHADSTAVRSRADSTASQSHADSTAVRFQPGSSIARAAAPPDSEWISFEKMGGFAGWRFVLTLSRNGSWIARDRGSRRERRGTLAPATLDSLTVDLAGLPSSAWGTFHREGADDFIYTVEVKAGGAMKHMTADDPALPASWRVPVTILERPFRSFQGP